MKRFLSALFGRPADAHPSTGGPDGLRARPSVEGLEDRSLMSVSAMISGNNLYITSNNASDSVTVNEVAGLFGTFIQVHDNNTNANQYFAKPSGRIYFYGNGGHDFFDNWTGLGATAFGGEGNDTLIGNDGVNDNLYGEGGADVFYLDGWEQSWYYNSDYPMDVNYGEGDQVRW